MPKLGLIGVGIVGNAFYEGMKHVFDIIRYDKFRTDLSDVNSIEELLKTVDGPIFVCVPTPMMPDGHASIEIVLYSLTEIFAYQRFWQAENKIVVVKSTVPPGSCANWHLDPISIVFNPEFLTEANPAEDFKHQDRIILGGDVVNTQIITDLYSVAYPDVPKIQCGLTEAEMVKYVGNCFLATKVSFANEIHQICDRLDVNYDIVVNAAMLDKRLGTSHWRVPGPDGHFGFGGSCFPKDLNALMATANDLGIDAKILKVVWEKNLEMRPEKDWEQLKGRAVL